MFSGCTAASYSQLVMFGARPPVSQLPAVHRVATIIQKHCSISRF